MRRYFFHMTGASFERDHIGTELMDDAAARVQAILLSGHLLAEAPDILADHPDLRIQVTDDEDRLLYTILSMALDAPPPRPPAGLLVSGQGLSIG